METTREAAAIDVAASQEQERSKGLVDQIITTVVDGIIVPVTGVIPTLLSSGILFLVFAAIWLAFGAGLIWNQGGVEAAWTWIRDLPLIVQGVVWLLFLPAVAALWAWETSWPLAIRLIVVVGLAGWSLMIFLPRSAQG